MTPDAASVNYVDGLGRSVELNDTPERVVSLAPNLTEIVYAAGGGRKLVGVTTADDYPPQVDTLPRFSALPLDFEKILSLKPDLALATDQINSPRDAETFASLGIPVYFFSFASLDDVITAIRRTGELLGTKTHAGGTADSLQAEIDLLRALTAEAADTPRVLMLIGDETLNAFGRESYVHELVELAGGESLTDSLGANPVLSEEFVLAARPDVIVGTWGAEYDVDRLRELHPAWEILPAFKQDRIYSLPGELIGRPGPRLVEGVQRLARLLHPELFQQDGLASESTVAQGSL